MSVQVSTVKLSEQGLKLVILSNDLENLQRMALRIQRICRESQQKLAETQFQINQIEGEILSLRREISA